MNTDLDNEQIESYRENGFLMIEDFLSPAELEEWRGTVMLAVEERAGQKMPDRSAKTGEDDGINADAEYFGKVFDQLVNLWQTNARMKKLILDARIGKMAAELSGEAGIRPWHDQALFKQPWGNPTGLHLDTPYWPFDHREALSIWIALDDATLENGCLFFMPGSHRITTFEEMPITSDIGSIFEHYPELKTNGLVAAPMKAGSCSFHNGLTIHGAHANMTPGSRRAITCAFMPDGARFNGKQNILSDERFSRLTVGDVLTDESQNPLIYSVEEKL